MPFIIGAAIVGSAALGAAASNKAAGQMSDADRYAASLAQGQYQQTRQDLMPWQEGGRISLSSLMALLGQVPNQRIPKTSEAYGSLLRPFTPGDLANEPGYQFGLEQGNLAINRGASAGGLRLSPATIKALEKFNQDYAGTKYGEAFGRNLANKQFTYNSLAGISKQGLGAAGQTGAFGQQAAGQSGLASMAGGEAQAAGTVGMTNAITGGLGQAINAWQYQNMLNKYLNPQPTGFNNPGMANYYGSGSVNSVPYGGYS